jgi:hypothetical protein|tara:strand:- start:534 stop:797 length:264 start_codon:yes stop_codon:yes gene_type:complete
MEKKTIQLLILLNNLKLVTQIEEVPAAVPGEPDCKMIEPYVLGEQDTLSPWLVECTSQNEFMISSDKILTMLDPKPTLLEKYEKLIK